MYVTNLNLKISNVALLIIEEINIKANGGSSIGKNAALQKDVRLNSVVNTWICC